jgi:hypothetical protein
MRARTTFTTNERFLTSSLKTCKKGHSCYTGIAQKKSCHTRIARKQKKNAEYKQIVNQAGHKFAPFVIETTGGWEAGTSVFLNLLIAGAHEKGHPNPHGIAQRFITEISCLRARCFAHQVHRAARAQRGFKPQHGSGDDTLLPKGLAIRALGPFAPRLHRAVRA